ncbi:hypothetical protein Acr_00g0025720 [Actinidia rufa]|uniref:Uncharacterized protein n=1 Tax=Actinidia rufa TaxID=165716 RepID=A0A7J0DES6_9ERIC|nr:hypothetical protein Acr_00g0025720 [Actinidia rufa]
MGLLMNLLVKRQNLKFIIFPPSLISICYFVCSTPCSPIPVSSILVMPTPASYFIQVTSKLKDECNYCHQKHHWKHSCPNRGQSKVQKGFSRSPSSSQASPQYSQHGTQHHSCSFTALAASASSDTSLLPSFDEFQ